MNDYIPTEDVEAPYSVTLRTGAGYDAALLTIRGNDAVQLISRLGELEVNDGLAKVVEFNAALQAKAGPSTAASGSSSRSSSGSDGNSGGSAPSGGVTYHPEGLNCSKCSSPVILKKITAKTGKNAGKEFKMWVCENQRERNDGHHSEFIN